MKLCVSSQWDDTFLYECSRYNVGEVYCSLRMGTIGSVRPAVCLPESTMEQARDHIKLAHSLGMEFNYIANAPCLGNIEYSYDGRKNLLEYFELIESLGVDTITLAIPYLIEIVKQEFSHLKVKVSEIANVGTAQRAKFYGEFGADIITVEIVHNRDFEALKSIRRVLDRRVELELVVNPACIFQCPYHDYHNAVVGHTTQSDHPLKGYYLDYCMAKCIPQKLVHPEEIIKAPWIRPEDVGEYEDIGIHRFKISNRVGPRRIGSSCLRAYSTGKCENLADLLTPLSLEIEGPPRTSRLDSFSEQEWEQVVSIWALPSPSVYIDNSGLEGFIDYFKTGKCHGQCGIGCDYCKEIAERVVKIDRQEVDKYVLKIQKLLQPLMALGAKKEEHILKMEWEEKLKDKLDRIIQDTPEIFRDVASKAVGGQAESNAEERGSQIVTREDLVKAFVSETPEVFKANMIESLKREGFEVGAHE